MEIDELDIAGGISPRARTAIITLANRMAKNNATFVEIGSWKGNSAILVANVLKSNGGHLYCVDHWRGSEGTELLWIAMHSDVYKIFEYNLKIVGLWDYITPIIMDSLKASKEFNNDIDFLFIDGDHRYQQFTEDLRAWMPKVKGIVCGHDCEWRYSKVSPEIKVKIDTNLDKDYLGAQCHPGVIKGLYDYFNDDYTVIEGTGVWFKEI